MRYINIKQLRELLGISDYAIRLHLSQVDSYRHVSYVGAQIFEFTPQFFKTLEQYYTHRLKTCRLRYKKNFCVLALKCKYMQEQLSKGTNK